MEMLANIVKYCNVKVAIGKVRFSHPICEVWVLAQSCKMSRIWWINLCNKCLPIGVNSLGEYDFL